MHEEYLAGKREERKRKNLQKLEDAGKMSSPKGDVSAKDIVSSIISAANRKMLRAATKGKKESSVEFESER